MKLLINFSFGMIANTVVVLLISATTTVALEPDSSTELSMSFMLHDSPSSTKLKIISVKSTPELVIIGGIEEKSWQDIGIETIDREGFPNLPQISHLVLIPPTADVRLSILNETSSTEFSQPPEIARAPLQEVRIKTDPSADYLSQDDFWPPQSVVIGKPAIMAGYRLLPVSVFLCQYNRKTGEMKYNTSVEFELVYEGEGDNIVTRPDHKRTSRIDRMVRSVVINPPTPQRDQPEIDGSVIYLIGDEERWDAIEESLQPLIEWRRRIGRDAIIMRSNSENAADIKESIQEAYDNWENPPEAVVLCGDTDGDYSLGFFDLRDIGNFTYETDHTFAQLEGDDVLPEISVGRLIYHNVEYLDALIAKIVQYESDPYVGEENEIGWQQRAMLIAGDNRSGASTIDLMKWSGNTFLQYGYDQLHERYFSPQDQRPDLQAFISDHINGGINFFLYRGWYGINGFGLQDVLNLDNDRMLPFVILSTCNTGDFAQHVDGQWSWPETFLRIGWGGAIGAVGTSGQTSTQYNNLMVAGMMNAIFSKDIHSQGWALMAGKLDLYRNYFEYGDRAHPVERGMENWFVSTYIYNLMGDPATELFTTTPQDIEVEHPDNLTYAQSEFNVNVVLSNDGSAVGDARVCLYQAGGFQAVGRTDSQGDIVLELNPLLFQDSEVMLTVSGKNLRPYLTELEIVQPENFIGAGEWSLINDNSANPAEEVEIILDVVNYGDNQPEGQLTATLTSGLQHLEVIDSVVNIDEAPQPGESVRAEFGVTIGGGFAHGEDALFILTVENDDETWVSRISIPVVGPELSLGRIAWTDESPLPGDDARARINITNTGDTSAPPTVGRLISLSPSVMVPDEDINFNQILIGQNGNSREIITLSISEILLKGEQVNLIMVVEAENGFTDTTLFNFTLSEAGDGDPFGPDDYGYVCVDNSDTSWLYYPEYEWVELDPELGGNGTNTELSDIAEERDESMAIDLPFTFRYYGQEFNEITICTNGWLAMGDQSNQTTGRNRSIPGGMVASGMICPFWDDLITTDEGGIFTWYDEEQHRFIVEWIDMRRLGPGGHREALETFEVILLDQEHYPSLTQDGSIIFQYETVEDARSCYESWDTPFATVGIASPNRMDGLEYTYYSQLHSGAAPLETGRAILFNTLSGSEYGLLRGRVSRIENDEPIEDVTVTTSYFQSTWTDEDGNWQIEYAFAGQPFTITASKQGFNPRSFDIEALDVDEQREINFALTHPLFTISAESIEGELDPGDTLAQDVALSNSGNGPLAWSVSKHAVGDANRELWELRDSYQAGELVEDDHLYGVTYAEGKYFFSGSAEGIPAIYTTRFPGMNEYTYFYMPEDGMSRRGMRDLTWDGELMWGIFEDVVYGFTTEGELIQSWAIDDNHRNSRYITWDSDRETLWLTDVIDYEIRAYDREGNWIEELDVEIDREIRPRKYGLAYYPDDPQGYQLYIMSFDNRDEEFSTKLYKVNIETNEMILAWQRAADDLFRPLGIHISPELDPYSWVLMGMTNNLNAFEQIDIWQLDTRLDWLSIEPTAGDLDPEAVQELTITLNTADFDSLLVDGEFLFKHNSDSGAFHLPVYLGIGPVDVKDDEASIPMEFGIQTVYPNPFNSWTNISFSLENSEQVSLRVLDLHGREVLNLWDGAGEAGINSLGWNAADMPSGIYFVRLYTLARTHTMKVAMVK